MSTLLYMSNWPFSEGLTQATVLPNLELLAQSDVWSKIIFATLESTRQQAVTLHPKIVHHPFCRENGPLKLLDRFLRWKKYRSFLNEIIKKENPTCIIARGAPAGIIASDLAENWQLPFYVESFEPHAEYMEESGVWKKWDPRYIKQKVGEKHVMRKASGLITVSQNYKKELEKYKVDPEKIQVVPCTVNEELFSFVSEKRSSVRHRFGIPQNALIGINVGKYGSIYHDEAAFKLFRFLFQNLPHYYQFFLTQDVSLVQERIADYHLPSERCKVVSAKYSEIPHFLSAADFGFVLVKSTPAKRFCSAIKTGEYWSCGLPIIITENIGDDSHIIEETGTGVVWDACEKSLPLLLDSLHSVLNLPGLQVRNRELATKHRNQKSIAESYSYFKLI